MSRAAAALLGCLLLACGAPVGGAGAQGGAQAGGAPFGGQTGVLSMAPTPDALANQPDPRDYVRRDGIHLQILDTSAAATAAVPHWLRFGGLNISWLALRDDSGAAADARYPTEFETKDLFATAQAMGVGTLRVLTLGASAGCPRCLAPTLAEVESGQLNAEALRQGDHILRLARDAGMKVVVPLAGAGICAAGQAPDPVHGTPCTFARWRGRPDSAFFTDARVQADFARYVTALLRHLNPETGLAYKDDPTILAWENCDGCGRGTDDRVLADWTELLGRTIKALDNRHLYENGTLAGRLGSQTGAELIGLPSVDIVGDVVVPPPVAGADFYADALEAVTRSGKAYVIDSYDWTPARFPKLEDLEGFFRAVAAPPRTVSGAFLDDLAGHAEAGGWLPPARPGAAALYFPGRAMPPVDLAAMQARARAVRRFAYKMLDLQPVAFAQTDPPEIIAVEGGRVSWRGAAGAQTYSIERTGDVTADGAWKLVCDQCATDASPVWQDPAVPPGAVWYRVTGYNANGHIGLPSAPMQNK